MAQIVGLGRAITGRRSWLNSLLVPLAAFLLTAGLGTLVLRGDWAFLAEATRATLPGSEQTVAVRTPIRFAQCQARTDRTCVVDGDTFRLDGEIIRIADIDTPEVRSPGCPAERALGERSTRRLVALLNAGGFTLGRIERDTDVYGRSLRLLIRDGSSLGQVLVTEGLAHAWDGGKRPWC